MRTIIRYLVSSYRAIFIKKPHIGYLALVTVLVTSGVFGACPYIYGIQQDDFMKTTVGVRLNSSLAKGSQDDWFVPTIINGTNMVIYIDQMIPGAPGTSAAGSTSTTIILETSQEGLEISENKITITEWSRAFLLIKAQSYTYFGSNGSGVLKIRKQHEKGFFGGQKTSFHGTASFNFTDPSNRSVDLTFLLNKREGALLFSIKDLNK